MMHDPGRHIIRKATVNFQYSGTRNGLQLQQEVTDYCRENLGPAIDAVLSEFDLTADSISIDTLKLDLTLDDKADWKKELSAQIIQQLKERIHPERMTGLNLMVKKSALESFTEILLYFLKFGILPWNASIDSVDEFKKALHGWISKISSSEIIKLHPVLIDPVSNKRLVSILEQNDFEALIAVIADHQAGIIASYFKDISLIIDFLTDDNRLKKNFSDRFKEGLFKHSLENDPEGFFKIAFAEWISEIDEKYPYHLYRIEITALEDHDIKMIVRQHQMNILKASERKKDKLRDIEEKPSEKAEKDNIAEELAEELKGGAFISNAGAIIIAPFLPALFSRTGISADHEIINEAAALSLVHYCISGHHAPAEFELLLPKVLCGIQPFIFPEMASLSGDNGIKEADEMLESVIEHWAVLKNTSIDGLRETFLQRNGKLAFNGSEWQLSVEQKPYDMLLEQLPWNIRLIRLPWMINVIKTHWN